MLNSIRGTRGMAVAPHALAAQAALAVLREGGNAIEAMIAAAATIAVVYPHMNSIGGDAFWLIHVPGQAPRAIDACGAAAPRLRSTGTRARYHAGRSRFAAASPPIPSPAPSPAGMPRTSSARELGGRLPLARLFADAIHYAEHGIPVTRSQQRHHGGQACRARKAARLRRDLPAGRRGPAIGSIFLQPRLGATLEQLAARGWTISTAATSRASLARDLAAAGSPLALADLRRIRRSGVTPLALKHSLGTLLQHAAADAGPGIAADPRHPRSRCEIAKLDPFGADYVHLCVEATKQAFAIRDRTSPIRRT